MAKARYNILLHPEPEGGYTVLVPTLPGCVTYGRTLDEEREMAKNVISSYIASLCKHNDPLAGGLPKFWMVLRPSSAWAVVLIEWLCTAGKILVLSN